ncbi:MAG: GNAT family N-acetyltransferase [Ruminococcus sp.]|nr:GNAT family N-acetyltransferase [Ruminococcus sp.]
MILTAPVLETRRCILRPLTLEDAEAVFQWAGDERVNTFMPYNAHRSPDDSRAWLKSLENEYQWGFVRKSDGLLMGSGGMRLRPDDGSWSFGYNLRYDCWNKGYATEVTGKMIEFIREKHDPERITAEHAVDNPASGRVMEKCGLSFASFGEYSSFDGTRTFRSKKYEWKRGG